MKILLLIATTLVAFNSYAASENRDISDSSFSVGASVGISTGPYRNYSEKVIPLPVIEYEGSVFFFHGFETGLKAYSSESNEVSFSVSFIPFSFKPKDSKNESLKNLNERKLSVMTNLSWVHKADWGFTLLKAGQKITGNRKGIMMAAEYGYPLQLGSTTVIMSSGLEFSNADINKYYFGISPDEANRSGLNSYHPGTGISPYIDLMAAYPLTESVELSAGARVIRLSDAIYNSPMVDERYVTSFFTSVSYNF